MANIRSYKELRVYQAAIDATMRIFEVTKQFPPEERYSMTDQMRRSSRSVCTNIAEAWRKRRYPNHFVSKITDSESEVEETPMLHLLQGGSNPWQAPLPMPALSDRLLRVPAHPPISSRVRRDTR
ncbi:MAG: four helix bundle protein [Caldilineales bacterium]|nr:four helix bundle protein [Caldilineales bacterium]